VAALTVSALAWRNLRKSSELQIRLVKAGEMNAHLSEMNFAAAGLAHETRNPLNLIRGLAQLIAHEPPGTEKLRESAARIVEEADRVTVQLNEFIHYSKPREARLAPVEIPLLVADVARTLQPDVEEKHLQLKLDSTPLTVEADAALLRQALFNLILNATQAVASGGRIDVRWRVSDAREAVLEVADDGPGVPPAERKTIFKPYVTMRPKGAGLGLAIVQQIVAAHHWEIECTDHPPRGALFRLRHLRVISAPSEIAT
jgi:signal transduction histidine kinase